MSFTLAILSSTSLIAVDTFKQSFNKRTYINVTRTEKLVSEASLSSHLNAIMVYVTDTVMFDMIINAREKLNCSLRSPKSVA